MDEIARMKKISALSETMRQGMVELRELKFLDSDDCEAISDAFIEAWEREDEKVNTNK